jgi:hypothetical protein
MKTTRFTVGEYVGVADQGLLMIQKFAPKNSFPNNYGKVEELWDDGKVLISFPLKDENGKLGYDKHSQVAPYPESIVFKREATGFEKKLKAKTK